MKRKILLFIFTLILVLTGITNINAYDKYDGDYTIEYLLKNYNVVTLGTHERYNYSIVGNKETVPGSVTNVFDIGGSVLIRGNYTGSTNLKWDNEFAQKTNCIPSYIKGKIGDKIKAGSIESAELSNIYVGSSNKVTENDGYYTVNNDTYKYKYPVKVSDDYVDFDKLYASIVNEQKSIEKGTVLLGKFGVSGQYKYNKNVPITMTITKPGYYEINDLSHLRKIEIKNYNPNEMYVITTNSEFITEFPVITIYSGDSSNTEIKTNANSVYYNRVDNDQYNGNIIWNMINARYIYTGYSTIGHIVAPKADIELYESHYPGTIIANSIESSESSYTAVQFYPLRNNGLSSIKMNSVALEDKDISDDLYQGNYSIDELLKNYSVVTLGQKEYGNNVKLKELSNSKGTTYIYHIGAQFLINGDLGVSSKPFYPNNGNRFKGMKLDLRASDTNYSSYVANNLMDNAWDSFYHSVENGPELGDILTHDGLISPMLSGLNVNQHIPSNIYFGNLNNISLHRIPRFFDTLTPMYLRNGNGSVEPFEIKNGDYNFITAHRSYTSNNYIDFKTLYDAIVVQQKDIEEGRNLTSDSDGVIHVPDGGNYTIDNINDINKIIFDNYEENKNKLIIITIKDTDNINLPVINTSSVGMPFSNDYYGGSTILGDSLMRYYEGYSGNIVWNIPNARYIKLAENAPFIGHIIAPNADVETPELHFAGAMIVNSLYTEGHSEAHFYPLTVGSVGSGIKKETKTIGGEVEKITISGTKTWDDNNNQDGLRPDSVTINLLANGEKVDSITITESDAWKYEFNVPRVDEYGVKINYTITEDAIEHYATKIESFSNDTCPSGCKVSIDGYNITNSYTPKKTSLTVNKVWKDENNADKLRSESVEVELYANGKKVSSAILNEENNWTYIFNEIDMNENGKKIEYTVKEKEQIKGYTTSISGDQETGYTITNTHVVKKENPQTNDNIMKSIGIALSSLIVIVLGIELYRKYNKHA